MPAFRNTWLTGAFSGAAAAATVALTAALTTYAGAAQAQTRNCGCTPPPPPPPPPPPACNCTPPTTVNVTVNTSSAAQSQSSVSSSSFSRSSGAGGVWMPAQAPAAGMIQSLNVDTGEAEVKRAVFEEKRKVERRMLIQAVCLDDRGAPHPASQVHPERDVADDYDGEIFRCIAGTRLQATLGDYNEALTLAHGETLACDKMQTLYHTPGGGVACRDQKHERDCNERSLLRRYGPGVKVLKLVREETVKTEREEASSRTAIAPGALMTLDGGVGGYH